MPYFTSSTGTNIHYIQSGTGQTIIFLHAFLFQSSGYPALFKDLSTKCQIYGIDLPYHGSSSGLHGQPQLSDLIQLISEFTQAHQLTDIVLIGHSLGAMIALQYARTHPVKKLILIEPVGRRSFIDYLKLCIRLCIFKPINDTLISPKASLEINWLAIKNLSKNIFNLKFWKLIHSCGKYQIDDFLNISCPYTIYLATQDEVISPSIIQQLATVTPQLNLVRVPGNHDWIILNPQHFSSDHPLR